MSRRAAGALGLIWTLSGGCVFKSDVAPDAVIRCDQDAQCPKGMRCQAQVRRCVDASLYDEVAPGIVAGSEQLSIRPDRDNPLGAPTALGRGSTLNVSFTATELLGSAPLLQGSCPLTCFPVDAAAPNYAFDCRLSAAATDGQCTLTAELVDRAGLAATVSLRSTLAVDVTPPGPPTTSAPGAVIWTRVPWGSEQTAGVPTALLDGMPGAAPDAVRILVRAAGVALADGPVDGGGFGPLALPDLETATLEVSSIDAAGNSSGWVNVHDAHWVATMGGKVPRRDAPNPNRFSVVGAHGLWPNRPDDTELGEASGLGRIDGKAASFQGSASWVDVGGQRAMVFNRFGARAAYAAPFGRVVRFGGSVAAFNSQFQVGDASLYAFDGVRWSRIASPALDPEADGNPVPRRWSNFVFDEFANRVLLQGGETVTSALGADGEVLDDLWSGNEASWKYLGPGPRVTRAASVWETRRARMLVIGGRLADAGLSGATLAWDGEAWADLDASVPPREGAAAAYDADAGVTWMFGGANASGPLNELWRFDGQSWSKVNFTLGPSPRWNPLLSWDSQGGGLIVASGYSVPNDPASKLTDLWAGTAAGWRRLGTTAAPFADETLTYNASRQQVVYAGTNGAGGGVSTLLLSEVDGGLSVVPVPVAATPDVNSVRPPLACLGALPGCVTSGVDGGALRLTDQGWLEIGGVWPSRPATMEANPRLGQLMTVGVKPDGGVSWATYSAATGASPIADLVGFTPGRTPHLVSTDQGYLLFSARSDVAGFRPDAGWQPANALPAADWVWLTSAPLPGGGVLTVGTTFDAGAGNPSIGAQAAERQNAPGWAVSSSSGFPTGLGVLCPDRYRSTVFHFGGVNNPPENAELLERVADGGWEVVPTSDPEGDLGPLPRVTGSCAFDDVGRRSILLGGTDTLDAFFGSAVPAPIPDFGWALRLAGHRPAAYFRVQLRSLALVAGSTIKRINLRAVAGASGQSSTGSAAHGFRWLIFLNGAWVAVDPNHQSLSPLVAPASDQVSITTPAVLESLLRGKSELVVGLVPEGVNGTAFARMAVDYVEAEVELALP